MHSIGPRGVLSEASGLPRLLRPFVRVQNEGAWIGPLTQVAWGAILRGVVAGAEEAMIGLEAGPFGDSGRIANRRVFHEFVLQVLSSTTFDGTTEPESLDDVDLRIALSRAIEAHGVGEDKSAAVFDRLVQLTTLPRPERGTFPALWLDKTEDNSTPESLRTVLDEATRNDLTGIRATGELVNVTPDLRARYDRACSLLLDLDPALTESVLPHATACVWVNVGVGDAVMESGSARTMPGVVLLSAGYIDSDFQAARALLHEAAHCKLFDLYLTRPILPADSELLVQHRVPCPWNADSKLQSNRWPVDQALAAAHVYVHLARLDAAMPATHRPKHVPDAGGRATYLLAALQDLPDKCLGPDGRELVGWLQGCLN